ncbi:DinB family protein [Nocardia higoensis]|uniref:DinB family protein n=1 Tax=Nocardia higoensis TaxID=228599 RepID=UPI0002E1C56D|nr:DinB family protein [Nocardia higoensis]
MAIVPDLKDWTWVLERTCPDCGYDAATVDYDAVPGAALASADRLRAALTRPDARQRPRPGVWSPTEYAAHVRDVCRIFVFRVAVITRRPAADPGITAFDPGTGLADPPRRGDDPAEVPTFANWDQDATAVADRYDEQDSAVVAEELTAAAAAAAEAFGSVPPAERGLRARRDLHGRLPGALLPARSRAPRARRPGLSGGRLLERVRLQFLPLAVNFTLGTRTRSTYLVLWVLSH